MNFTNKKVLIIGGSSGIGRGIANCFLSLEAEVCITGTKASLSKYDVDDPVSEKCNYLQLNLLEDISLDNFILPFETLNVLICSQGIVKYGRKEFELDVFREVLAVNLVSMMACCQKFKPLLAASSGNIIMLGSGASYRAVKGNPAYSASKGGILTLIKTLADAWAEKGIRVNGLAPGFVATKLTEITFNHKERYKSSLKNIPMGRWGNPEEIGDAACFLASEKASYITGQMITVDGGLGLS